MPTVDEMSDQEFLDYFSIHSETERALFHVRHCSRFLSLAGLAPIPPDALDVIAAKGEAAFFPMTKSTWGWAIDQARRNLAERENK